MKLRLTIRPPRGPKGKWSLILDKITNGKRVQSQFKPEELSVLNENYLAGAISYNSALTKIEDIKKHYLEVLEVESGVMKKVVTCAENQKLFLQYWNREYVNRDIEEESLKSAEYQFKSVLGIMGDLSFYTCSLSQIRKKMGQSSLAPETVRHLVHKFNILLAEAGNKIKLSKPEKQHEEISYINSTELEQLANKLEEETVKHVLYIGFYTGMRQGEIWAINESTVDFGKRLIKVNAQISRKGLKKNPKENKRRIIVFPKKLDESLEFWLNLSAEERKAYRYKTSVVLRETAKKLWPKRTLKHISIHDLRRSFVIYCLQEVGMTLSEVAFLTGDTLAVLQSNYSGYSYNEDGIENLRKKYSI